MRTCRGEAKNDKLRDRKDEQCIEEIMIELGYEWDGAEFVEARYDEKREVEQ